MGFSDAACVVAGEGHVCVALSNRSHGIVCVKPCVFDVALMHRQLVK